MRKFLVALAVLGLCPEPALAHRLDEYLQATILSLRPGAVYATLRMVPGVAVSPEVIAHIDKNSDGLFSSDEQRGYATEVLRDLHLREDGRPLNLNLESTTFPSIEQIRTGLGEIQITFSAALRVDDQRHELSFDNDHESKISVYLVNILVPDDHSIELGEQWRNENQSRYRVSLGHVGAATSNDVSTSGFAGAFRLGMSHIAEGTDHLLFLLTLLLPAPLLAFAGRWRKRATVSQSLLHILRIVTAFTVGHSLTLALSVFGPLRLPSRPVEVFVALSILLSAIHAARPLFPGREAVIAAFFGLIHGLAFASALYEVGVTGWYRVISLLGFNIGIETVQLAVVTATLPALLLLSRTLLYSAFRISGAGIAGTAAVAWIVERLVNRPNAIGQGVEKLAKHGSALAGGLWVFCLAAWLLPKGWQFPRSKTESEIFLD